MAVSWSAFLQAKLGIREGTRVGLANAPSVFVDSLGELPAGASVVPVSDGALDVVLYFSTDHSQIGVRVRELIPQLAESGELWVAWPMKVPGVPLTLVEDQAREMGVAAGLVESRVSAIDETWTGMRFVRGTGTGTENGEQGTVAAGD